MTPQKLPSSRGRTRLDEALVGRGLTDSRSRARALILAGDALVNGVSIVRAGTSVLESDELSLKSAPRFVSRGGDKLNHGLDAFGLDVRGAVVADFGASTGGFTDCLLQRGASRVYAIDVGYGQMVDKLRQDARVIVMDRVNARQLDSLPEAVDLVTIDVSFIGLNLVLPAASRLLNEPGRILALIKPQFEAGRADVGRGGVVRDPRVHRRVLKDAFTIVRQLELGIVGLTVSPLRGPAGNVEFLSLLKPRANSIPEDSAIDRVMEEAAIL
ncbi:MAG: TlyA family RNA methyltransferase [Chloroflexia bacterium]|nr:TlyA family RNA methyltransferase [Chloroflexia bacterium]